jgi:rod shape-determining protein MreC
VFRQEVLIAAGSADGVRMHDPVVVPQGLVGTVIDVTSHAAKVRLLTDQESAASAVVVDTGAGGIVQRGLGSDTLILARVPKEEEVALGNVVVTAGSSVGGFQSLFPRGIPICEVTSVSQRDIDTFKSIQCTPLVEFASLHQVIVLVPKERKG